MVVHKLEGGTPAEGSRVAGNVNPTRRQKIRRIHTATHLLNGASRHVLGPWVWQHSAFKEEDYGRLDITHFAKLTDDDVRRIEDTANDMVMKDFPIVVSYLPRKEAEAKYGFRLFQGGVVPSRILRIVNIADWDVEACGGTHTNTTGQVGFIKVMRTERIQDGVERLVFVAGYPAVGYVQQMDSTVDQVSSLLNTQRENIVKVLTSMKQELDETSKREKALGEKLIEASASKLLSTATVLNGTNGRKAMLYVSLDVDVSEELIVSQGAKLVKEEPSLVFASVAPRGNSTRLICFVGLKAKDAGVAADALVRELAKACGGSGGGTKEFAQGGGPKPIEDSAAEGPADENNHRDHREVDRSGLAQYEKHWLKVWNDKRIFESESVPGRKKAFVTFPFAYMNGPLHIGHCFTATRVRHLRAIQEDAGLQRALPLGLALDRESIPGMSYRLSLGDEGVRKAFLEIDGVPEKEVERFVDPEYLGVLLHQGEQRGGQGHRLRDRLEAGVQDGRPCLQEVHRLAVPEAPRAGVRRPGDAPGRLVRPRRKPDRRPRPDGGGGRLP